MTERRKLIEVAMPLEAISAESSLRKRKAPAGYPTTIHKWWAQRPLAACRAVIFASLVDDPSSRSDEYPTEEEQDTERQRLFALIEELVKWENSGNHAVVNAARIEIMKATSGEPPPLLDPFCGGGSIPLEAQRLGLETSASDLNPVAVLVTKALTEIPPKFAGQPPVNPEARRDLSGTLTWPGATGLAADVRYYGKSVCDEAFNRIGDLYPKVRVPDHRELPAVAWIWARKVQCPDPACGALMPLLRSFALSTRKGKEWSIEPVIDRVNKTVRFTVRQGPPTHEATKRLRVSECLFCRNKIDDETLRRQSIERGISTQLAAIVVQDSRGRRFVDPPRDAAPVQAPETPWLEQPLPANARWFSPPGYGLRTYRDLFTPRQIVSLTTFSDLIGEARQQVLADGGSESYAQAVATFLAFVHSRAADYGNSFATWRSKDNAMRSLFAQQAIPMTWDFAEGNPFGSSSSGFLECVEVVAKCVDRLPASAPAVTQQLDATAAVDGVTAPLICTDPPYYDNMGYADLADFFYVWLRRTLGGIYPELFTTLLTPKSQELVADPYRFDGDSGQAERFFERGLRQAFQRMLNVQHPDYPLTLFYAFKQAEIDDGAVASTGWDTMLTGLLDSGYAVTGTWPMRTEGDNRNIGIGANALASSIVLVCRPRSTDAPMATRREFVTALRDELPQALKRLQHGNIAPVDLAQAAIGPGMAIFSRYARVVEADGSSMTVRTALALINQALDEILSEQEGDFDADTRFAVTWFEQRGTNDGPYGEADVLARAKNTSVTGMMEAGVLGSLAGKVRLLPREELPEDWDPLTDRRLTAWEATQHLTRRLEISGEAGAADLLRRLGGDYGEQAKELAYRLYVICERKGWAQEALGYNALVVAWPEIARQVAGTPEAEAQQQLEV
jgi:putative DNA methylase